MKKRLLIFSILILGMSILFSWSCKTSSEVNDPGGINEMLEFQLTSTAFEEGGKIPVKYTCHGENVSPPLAWSNVPQQTRSFVLVFDDPDAGGGGGVWTHWVLYDIPVDIRSLPEDANANLPAGILVGLNSWQQMEYGGPCPGATNHYYFKLYALDTMLNLPAGAALVAVENAMDGHQIAVAQLSGYYR